MLANDIKEGFEVRMTHGRRAIMRDNKKGIIRVVEVEVPGQGTDVGSSYIDEMVYARKSEEHDWEEVEIIESHRSKLKNIRVVW